MEIIGNIYETKDYNIFKLIKENRQLDLFNRHEIMTSITEQGQLCPIIVDTSYQILDGQHRFDVCKELDLPIKFIQIASQGIADVYTMNNVSKKWNIEDSLHSGVARGDKNYIEVKNIYDKVKKSVKVSVIVMVLAQGTFSSGGGRQARHKHSPLKKFKNQVGYEVDFEALETNDIRIKQFADVFNYVKKNQDITAGAFFNYIGKHEEYNHERMMAQIEKYGDQCFSEFNNAFSKSRNQTTVLNRVRMLAKVYNFHKKDKVVFYVDKIV